jgi:hypothetical protein
MQNNRRLAAAAALATFTLAAAATATGVATAQDTPPAPPSIVQLCAATGVEEVDDLLGDVARSELVGELSPLLTLLVPDSETVELDASVQLADVRERLNCAPTGDEDDDTDPTPDPDVEDPDEPGADNVDDQDDEDLPNGLPDAAPRPTVVDADLTVTG